MGVGDSPLPPVAGRDYPPTWSQFLDWFADEDACMKNSCAGRVGLCVHVVGRRGIPIERRGLVDVSWLSPSMYRDGWNRVREDSHAVAELVCRGVVCNQSETRCQCLGSAARPGLEQLPDGVGDAAPVAPAMVRPGRECLAVRLRWTRPMWVV
jgi:hypothetical protein